MAEAAVATRSRREASMRHAWDRCNKAWDEGDFEQALCLDRLYTALESMTDEEYEEQFDCGHDNCDCCN